MKKLILFALSFFTMFSCTDLTGIQEQLNNHESRLVNLELICSQMNTNIESMKIIVDAIEEGDYITDVKTFKLEGKDAGYVISFAKGKDITIYHGKTGEAGASGITPTIGVKKDTDGIYYWTVNSDWLLDEAGNKIKALGQDGNNGKPGENGLKPELKIDGGYWYVKYGNSEWKQLGKATGDNGIDGDSFFNDLIISSDKVTLVLSNGEELVIPRIKEVINNKILYSTTDGKILFPSTMSFESFGARLISNDYKNGVGTLIFDDEVKCISNGAFEGCYKLLTITIPSGVSCIGDHAFSNCDNLKSIEFSTGLQSIEDYAFYYCDSLNNIILPEGLLLLGECSFNHCISLEEISIPSTVISIGESSFAQSKVLSKVYFRPLLPPEGVYSIFDARPENLIVYVPLQSINEYRRYKPLQYYKVVAYNYDTLTPIPDEKILEKTIDINGTKMVFVEVKGGSFTMGGIEDQYFLTLENEKPSHQVTLSDFYISKFEVTQEIWTSIMKENPSLNQGNILYPVENISWETIVTEFIPKLNKLTGMKFMLPTEAQWEYAAKGGRYSRGFEYSGGAPHLVAWHKYNSNNELHKVGQCMPNELGLYDMSGNVSEWCSDWYSIYDSIAQEDPIGPVDGESKILRGGNYSNHDECRVIARNYSLPTTCLSNIGFRLVVRGL